MCAKDRRRSLELHRRLAVGCAVAGLILAAAYLFSYWWKSSGECPVSGVIRNALALFLGFVFLGLAAAVIAQKVGRKVYKAGDAPGGRLATAERGGSNGEPAAPAAAAVRTEESAMAAPKAAPDRTKVAAAPARIAQPKPVAAPPDSVLPQAPRAFEPVAAAPPTSKPPWQFEPSVPKAPDLPAVRLQSQPAAAQPELPTARPKLLPLAEPASSSLRWLTETPEFERALAKLEKASGPHTPGRSWETESAGKREKEAAAAAEEMAPATTPSRLSGLRGLFSVPGSKEKEHLATETGETKTARAPQPERAASAQNLASVPAPPERKVAAENSTAVPARVVSPLPEPEPVFAPDSGSKESTQRVTAGPESLPPKPLEPTRRDRSEAFDEVPTLPSRRGQYKRKD